jgi:hypothetical protein
LLYFVQRFDQAIDVGFGRAQDMKCKPLRRLLSDRRQAFELN